MKITKQNKVIHTKLEMNIIVAVEYLLALRKKMGVKANLLELTKELGINSIDYSQTRSKVRGFTKAKIPTIVGKLQSTFGVKKEFLYEGKLPILQTKEYSNYLLKDDGGFRIEDTNLEMHIVEQGKEIKNLKLQLADKIAIIEAQALAIENFKALLVGKN